MNLYEIIKNGDLSKLSAEEFTELLNLYEKDIKKLGLPVSEQTEISDALRKETERRKYAKDDFKKVSADIEELEIELKKHEIYKKTTPAEYLNDNLDNRISALKSEIAQKKAEIDRMKAEKEASKLSSQMEKKIKLSIINKKIDNSKKVVAGIPQRICSLSKRKLSKMYNSVRNKLKNVYHNVNDFLDRRSVKVEAALDGLFDKQNDALQTPGITPAQRYIIESNFKDEMDKQVSRYRKVERQKHVLATLKTGTVRMINLPKDILNKLRGLQKIDQNPPQASMSM